MADNFEIRREKSAIKEEIAIIPRGAFVVAAIIFVLPVCFFLLGWFRQRPTPPFAVLMGMVVATLLAALALMIGYVNRDAGRRGMSRKLWTLIVMFVPNAIGFVLYFLMRNPLRVDCPKCGTAVDQHVNYCPHCRYGFHPTCPQCKTAVRPTDTFCANCGGSLETPPKI